MCQSSSLVLMQHTPLTRLGIWEGWKIQQHFRSDTEFRILHLCELSSNSSKHRSMVCEISRIGNSESSEFGVDSVSCVFAILSMLYKNTSFFLLTALARPQQQGYNWSYSELSLQYWRKQWQSDYRVNNVCVCRTVWSNLSRQERLFVCMW